MTNTVNTSGRSEAEARKDRIRAVAAKVADNLDKGSGPYAEFEETLEYGNSWTMEKETLLRLMHCYKYKKDGSYFGQPWGLMDRASFVEAITDVLYKRNKDFTIRDENTIYIYEFEAEHQGDISGIVEELKKSGADVLGTKSNYSESTGYAFFAIKDENVQRFEKSMGKLRNFRISGKMV